MPLGILPAVSDEIGEQFKRAVAASASDFDSMASDENALSGALGARLKDYVRGGKDGYEWETNVYKLPTQEKDVDTEEIVGADVAITVEYKPELGSRKRKTLLVQAKKRGNPHYDDLEKQAEKLTRVPGVHIVVEYSKDSYQAVPASEVEKAKGYLSDCREKMKDFGSALADEFLACKWGRVGLRYDQESKEFQFGGAKGMKKIRARLGFLVHTLVARVG